MNTDYCAFPPQIAADVEIVERRDGDRLAFIASSASVGRYLLIRNAEYCALRLLDEKLMPVEVCAEYLRRHGRTLRVATLTRFLAHLDEVGILEGERRDGRRQQEQPFGAQYYIHFKIFNPDRLFTRLLGVLGWVWTTPFFSISLLLILIAGFLALLNRVEVAYYGGYILREHYVAVLVAGLLVGVTHEFAHGLTCKAFGGRATEVGALLIYYFLPALYCNVSGIHMIPQRGRRLWVIAAGVYWQLLVGASALLAWLLLAPHTLLADLTFILFCGSVLDVAFNGNPLIKLDGYYFLSQWLRTPNLMGRSRDWWRDCLRRIVFGAPNGTEPRFSRREQAILAAFGLLCFVYTLALRLVIMIFLGSYLVDWFHLPGLVLALAMATFYARGPLGYVLVSAVSALRAIASEIIQLFSMRLIRTEANMTIQDPTPQLPSSGDSFQINAGRKPSCWRRWFVPLAIALFIALILCLPWDASVGAYGELNVVPGQEAIIRAPDSAILTELRVRPGDRTTAGAVIGRMSARAPELEEQFTHAQVEIDKANADRERLLGELRAHEASIAQAEVNLRQRQMEYDEIDFERRQIEEREGAEPNALTYLTAISPVASARPAAGRAGGKFTGATAAAYPAAIAVLQSEAELRQAKLSEAALHLDRTHKLYAQGIAPRSELEKAETNVSMITLEGDAARQRLAAFLIDHRRRHAGLATQMQLSRSDVWAERLRAVKLNDEVRAVSVLISTLSDRRESLRRRLAQFELVALRPGAVFGEELPRMVGQYFPKGSEICRIADTRQLLARIRTSEREIGDVQVGYSVRLKVGAYPDQIFHGRVAKIGGESETDQYNQAVYRVELVIENTDDLLRPGMTAFARIGFGRWMIGAILLHKLRQALRPELWMT
jgi:putative peptide zinc metalloprotease protein